VNNRDNNDIISRNYAAKVLLAGEYTVINGGSSLAIPFEKFSGHLCFNSSNQIKHVWLEMVEYLRAAEVNLDLKAFEGDIEKGLHYKSDIPIGYGCGSSGALVASIYDRYKIEDVVLSHQQLQVNLGKMESMFHGLSSGIDPFVILTNMAVISRENEKILLNNDKIETRGWSLIDSKKSRSTAEFVALYKKDIKQKYNSDLAKLRKLNDELISQFQTKVEPETVKQISKIQYEVFGPMILPELKHIWEEGLKSDKYFLKLCGAGGGGFYLMYQEGNEMIDIEFKINHL
jgi:mevalonate kinase